MNNRSVDPRTTSPATTAYRPIRRVSETPAPLAVGAGIALMSLATIFGPAPLLVGLLPFAWGAATWLGRARAELDSQTLDDEARRP